MDTAADANFADMYLHPQETSYDLARLFRFVEAAGLHFAGFSNPQAWDLSRLLGGELLERALALPPRQQWELVESLDPDISHFEFFLAATRSAAGRGQEDEELLASGGERNRCLWGWPSTSLMGPDLQPLSIEPEDLALMQALEAAPGGTPLAELDLPMPLAERAERTRRLMGEGVFLAVAP